MKINTHYDNLKVARDASLAEIKRAFRKLTFQHHPDRNPPELKSLQERRMRIIKDAYDTLSDPKRRKAHDVWIAQQESTQQEKGKHEQNGEYDEENTYHNNRNRQSMYYKELLEKERGINLSLREANAQLETELYNATALAEFLRNENNGLKRRGGELATNIDRLEAHIEQLTKIHSTALRKATRLGVPLKCVAAGACLLLCAQLTYSWLYEQKIDPSVLAVLSDNVKRQSRITSPEWKIDTWNDKQFILSKEKEGKHELINIIHSGTTTKKLVMKGLQGRWVGRAECDTYDPLSPFNNGGSVHYRFVQLETNTVLSVTVPYSHLCKPVNR